MADTLADTGYRWRDKDPILDLVNACIHTSGLSHKQISEHSRVSMGTLKAWDVGKVRKPQAATVRAVLEAVGYSLVILRNADQHVSFVSNPRTGRKARPYFREVASRRVGNAA